MDSPIPRDQSPPVPPRGDQIEDMDFPGRRIVFIEKHIPVDREHPDIPLEDRTRFREGAEGLDKACLNPLQEIEDSRDAIHIDMIGDLDQCGVDPGGEDNRDGLHGVCVQEARRRARSRSPAK